MFLWPVAAWAQPASGSPPADWSTLLTEGGEIAFLVAATGLIYRSLRLSWPEVPEAVVQIIAAVLATTFNLVVLWRPDFAIHQWITIGVVRGVLRSQNVIKSMDWAVSSVTKTGAPEAGLAEKPPAWWVAAQVSGTVKPEVTFKSPEHLAAQIKANQAAHVKAEACPPKGESA